MKNLNIIKKNYNNQLENILEYKQYSENSKSFLLSMLYKIEASYPDYKKTKEDTQLKEEYINNLLKIIKKELKILEIRKAEEAFVNTFTVKKEEGKVIAFPIDRKVLYAIYKLANQDDVVKGKNKVLNKTITELINIGSNIDKVEVIRDFNGYSWASLASEIESIEYNIIYQNLRILIGSTEINKLTDKEFLILDNYNNVLNKVKEKYGEENSKEIVQKVQNLSLLLYVKYNKAKEIYKVKEKVDKELEIMNNHTQYIKSLMAQKAQMANKIKKIDKLLLNEESLEKEYEKRNEKLPPEKKIFSKRILLKVLEKEKQEYIKKQEKLTVDIGFNEYVKKREKVLEKQEIYNILNETEENNEKLEKNIQIEILELQKIFLNCFEKQIDMAKTKEEIISKIKTFRYYLEIYIFENTKTRDKEELKEKIVELKEKVLTKAIELNAIMNLNFSVLENIFDTKIIDLLDINVKILSDKKTIEIYDEDILDEKKEIKLENISKKTKSKLNKKIKILM